MIESVPTVGLNLNDRKTVKWLFLISMAILVTSLTILTRSSLVRNYGDPVGYNGPGAYALKYIEETGHLPEKGDVDAPTHYSGGVYYSTGVPCATTQGACMAFASGDIQSIAAQLLVALFLTIAFLFAAGAVVCSSFRMRGARLALFPGVLALLLLGFGSPGVFGLLGGANAGFELVVILVCLRILLSGVNSRARVIALLVMSFFLPTYHFTAGAIYISLLVGFMVLTLTASPVSVGMNDVMPPWISNRVKVYGALYGAYYLGYVTILAPDSFGPYAGFYMGLSPAGPSSNLLSNVINPSSPTFFVLNAVNLALFVLPVIVVSLWLLAKYRLERGLFLFALCMFIPLLGTSVLFFLWKGLTGVIQRVTLYLVYPTALVIPIGGRIGKRFVFLLFVTLVLGLPLTSYIYAESPYATGNYAVPDEEQGAEWAVSSTDGKQVVFTDLRLSGLFVSRGHMYTVGISDSGPDAEYVPFILESVFYSPNQENVRTGIETIESRSGFQVEFLFVSSRMSMQYPSIRGYDFTFRPAAEDFMSQYDRIVYLDLICDEGQSSLYQYYR